MSDFFEARRECPALRRAKSAYIACLLDEMLPHLRLVARGCGYSLAVHGSLARDIDLIAIPWTKTADAAELLVQRLCGCIAGFTGRALSSRDWTDKPHGRRALTIITAGDAEIDLSIMPRVEAAA